MNILSSVFTKLEESEDWDSVDELLNAASVTEKEYIDALHWKKTSSGQLVLLKRSPSVGSKLRCAVCNKCLFLCDVSSFLCFQARKKH